MKVSKKLFLYGLTLAPMVSDGCVNAQNPDQMTAMQKFAVNILNTEPEIVKDTVTIRTNDLRSGSGIINPANYVANISFKNPDSSFVKIISRHFLLNKSEIFYQSEIDHIDKINSDKQGQIAHERQHIDNLANIYMCADQLTPEELFLANAMDEASANALYGGMDTYLLHMVQSGQPLGQKDVLAVVKNSIDYFLGTAENKQIYLNTFLNHTDIFIKASLYSNRTQPGVLDRLLNDLFTYKIDGRTIRLADYDKNIGQYAIDVFRGHIENYDEIINRINKAAEQQRNPVLYRSNGFGR